MIKIIVNGANGNMGKFFRQRVSEEKDMKIVAGVDIVAEKEDIPIYYNISDVKEEANAIIDYSVPEALESLCNYALLKRIPLLIGTTGLSEKEYDLLRETSKTIPVFQSPNMHLGVLVFLDIVKRLTQYLYDWDIEIIDTHHRYKIDAPSGVANKIMTIIKNIKPDVEFVFDRSTRRTKRKQCEVGVFSVRGGSMVGGHRIIFMGQDQQIEFSNIVANRNALGQGAIDSVRWMINKPVGFYTSMDIVESKRKKD